MDKFTIDTSYLDIETKEMCGDMCFWFETTLSEDIFCDSPEEMQNQFESAFNNGEMQDILDDVYPQVYCVCKVRYDNHDNIPVGVDLPVIVNVVMPNKDAELRSIMEKKVSQLYPCKGVRWFYQDK